MFTITASGKRLAVRAGLLALVFGLLLASSAEACPSCKAALANQRGQGDWVSGFFFSILFMVSMPFLCVVGFVTYMLVLVRRAKRNSALRPPPLPGATAANGPAHGSARSSEREQPAELIEA